MFERNCPKCNKKITYEKESNFNKAIISKAYCYSCAAKKGLENKEKEFKRECPVCKKSLFYSKEKNRNNAENLKKKCFKCASKESQNRPEQKEKLSNASKGKNNPMYGRSFYEIWLENFGKEEAELREVKRLEKISTASSGENNPMYGKPSPQGSGNGWSGKYKGKHFRSLNELYYLKHLLDNDIKFDNAEKKKYRVSYEFNGTNRSYGMDFYLVETDEYIEIKPKKLIKSRLNIAKFNAAIETYGNKFKILTEDDLRKISLDEMVNLYQNGELKFDKKYEEKFFQLLEKNNLVNKI